MPAEIDRLTPNRAQVAAEVVEGTVILIHLTTASYYSMEQSAAHIWGLIERGHSMPEIVASLSTTYDVTPTQAEADLARLVATLVAEDLVLRTADATAAPDPELVAAPDPALQEARLPYQEPELAIFRDLSPLVANDPPVLVPLLEAGMRRD